MQNTDKELYKDYLVRTVKEEIGKIFSQKMDEAKKEYLEIDYKSVLNKTEEILKNYPKLKKHLELNSQEQSELLSEMEEYYNEELKNIMTNLFSEEELYLESLLKSKVKTRMFVIFINNVINNYMNYTGNDKIEIRKRNILKEIYINGIKQIDFIDNNYEVERTFYIDKEKLIKDLAPYFFGIKGLNI